MTEAQTSNMQILKCPQCGAANSLANAYCRKCDADMSLKREMTIPMWAVGAAVGAILLFTVMALLEVLFQAGIYVGFILFFVGGLLAVAGNIWFLINAFKASVMWGLACLFVPLVSLVFLIKYPAQAMKPFMVSAAGVVLIIFTGAITSLV